MAWLKVNDKSTQKRVAAIVPPEHPTPRQLRSHTYVVTRVPTEVPDEAVETLKKLKGVDAEGNEIDVVEDAEEPAKSELSDEDRKKRDEDRAKLASSEHPVRKAGEPEIGGGKKVDTMATAKTSGVQQGAGVPAQPEREHPVGAQKPGESLPPGRGDITVEEVREKGTKKGG